VGEDWMRAFERYVGIGGMASTISALDGQSPGKIDNTVGGLMRMIICEHWQSYAFASMKKAQHKRQRQH
jgi:hypothetical protein